TMGGAPTDPMWVRNVLADPEPSVELGDRTVAVRTFEITGPEADELYARQVERRPGFAEYKTKTSRWIPFIALDPTPCPVRVKPRGHRAETSQVSSRRETPGRRWATRSPAEGSGA